MKTSITTAVLSAFVLVIGAGFAHAQVGAEVRLEAGAQASSSAKGNVETEWKVEEGESMKESGEKGGTADINIGVGEMRSEEARMQAAQHNESDMDFVGGNVISVAAVEVRGWDAEKKQAFLATVKTEAQVRSGQDLENFARGILLRDENVEELSADEDRVVVRYRVPAKFLGIFETSVPVEVVAENAQGELGGGVKVRFPWYKFLFATDEAVSEDSIEGDVSAEVEGDLDDASFDARAAARLYVVISDILKVKNETAIRAIQNTLE